MTPVDAIWLFLVKTYSLCLPLRGYLPFHPVGVLYSGIAYPSKKLELLEHIPRAHISCTDKIVQQQQPMAVPELIFTQIYSQSSDTLLFWHCQPYMVRAMLCTPARLSISASRMLLTKRIAMFSLTSGITQQRSYTSAFKLSPVGDDTDLPWHKVVQARLKHTTEWLGFQFQPPVANGL